jgi:isoleucyl-tRNA synthetase
MGIEKYNGLCRGIVMKYSEEWKKIIERYGRWIDMENDYKTMDLKFMESVWNVFSEIYKKGLVYRGCKIMPYSNKCSTVLSNFETQ